MEINQRKQRKKGFLAGCIVCILFGIFSLCGAIFISPFLVTIDDTEEYFGTIDIIEKREDDLLISLDGYSVKLLVAHEIVSDNDALSTLIQGDEIYFRLFKWERDTIQQDIATQIVPLSLRTDRADIITLESFNADTINFVKTGRIVLGCVSSVLLIGSIIFLVLYIKRAKNIIIKEPFNQTTE